MEDLNDINDINNLTDADLQSIFDDIDFEKEGKSLDTDDFDENGEIIEEGNGSNGKSTENQCQNCKTAEFIIDDNASGVTVCKQCGQVMDFLFDHNPEWRQYEDDGGKTGTNRCSMPINPLLPQSSLGTSIAGNYKTRLKTLHSWSAMPYKERSLNVVLKEIAGKCKKGNILKCVEDDAKIMYKHISECKHIKGKNSGKTIIIRGVNRKGLIAACVFFACRKIGSTRSPQEISDLFGLKYTEITKGCKTFLRLIKLSKIAQPSNSSMPEHFVRRFCEQLKLKKDHLEKTLQITKNIQKLNVASVHTPLSLATGSILLMAEINGIQLTKKEIAAKFNVSEVTITKAYKKIELFKNALVDDELTNKLHSLMSEESGMGKLPDKLQKKYDAIKISCKKKLCDINEDISLYLKTVDGILGESIRNTHEKYKLIPQLSS